MDYEIRKYFPDSPGVKDLLADLSGFLINSHPALDYPRSLPPTFIEIGGFQIERAKKLPKV